MMEGPKFSKQESHLNKGVKPIMTCVGVPSNFGSGLDSFTDSFYSAPESDSFYSESNPTHNIDYSGFPPDLEHKNFLHGGYQTYVLSTPDNRDKFSRGLADCTGLVIAGVDKTTGENISFLSHQDPKKFLYGKKEDFIKHLRQRLAEIKDMSVPGTIDAVVVGGTSSILIPDPEKTPFKKNYLDSIKLFSAEIKQALGFEPSMVNGPKRTGGTDDIYYDNKNRRLYFVRPEVNDDTGSFTQSDIEKEKKKWKKTDFE